MKSQVSGFLSIGTILLVTLQSLGSIFVSITPISTANAAASPSMASSRFDTVSVNAMTIVRPVGSTPAAIFADAIAKAALAPGANGTRILLPAGTYADLGKLILNGNTNATLARPIFFEGAPNGETIITGKINLEVTGNYIVVKNLYFKNLDSVSYGGNNANVTFSQCNSCALLDSTLDGSVMGSYGSNDATGKFRAPKDAEAKHFKNIIIDSLGSSHIEIGRTTFKGKSTMGSNILVYRKSSLSTPTQPYKIEWHRVFSNYFSRILGHNGLNDFDVMRIGDSSASQTPSPANADLALNDGKLVGTIVEGNLFENVTLSPSVLAECDAGANWRTYSSDYCGAEPEVISVKAPQTIIRYNTFRRVQGGLTLRHGFQTIVEGNYFIGTNTAQGFTTPIKKSYGIRLIGENHIVVNNHIENTDEALTSLVRSLFAGISLVAGNACNTQQYYGTSTFYPYRAPQSNADPELDYTDCTKNFHQYLPVYDSIVSMNTLIGVNRKTITLSSAYGSRATWYDPLRIALSHNVISGGGINAINNDHVIALPRVQDGSNGSLFLRSFWSEENYYDNTNIGTPEINATKVSNISTAALKDFNKPTNAQYIWPNGVLSTNDAKIASILRGLSTQSSASSISRLEKLASHLNLNGTIYDSVTPLSSSDVGNILADVTPPTPEEPTPNITITISKIGNGIVNVSTPNNRSANLVCDANCTTRTTSGAIIIFTASALSGSTFIGWGGACSGTGANCSLRASQDTRVTAEFRTAAQPTIPLSQIVVNKTGSGGGTISGSGVLCGTNCTSSIINAPLGSTVTLSATALSGSVFSGWSAPCNSNSSNATCTVIASWTTTIFANFTPLVTRHTLTVRLSGSGAGTVTGTGINCGIDCTESLIHNTSITLRAVITEGSLFQGWSEPSCGSSPICTVNISSTKAVLATFITKPLPTFYQLTTTKIGSGTIVWSGISCGVDCSENYRKDTQVTLRAIAATGAVFNGWDHPACITQNPTCTITMDTNATIRANFVPAQYLLAIKKSWGGSGTVTATGILCGTDCTESFTRGTIVTLSARPLSGSTFEGWSEASCGTATICRITLSGALILTASFGEKPTPQYYTLTVVRSGSGIGSVTGQWIMCGTSCSVSVLAGNAIALTATPESGSQFAGWNHPSCTPNNRVCTVTLTGSTRITAIFTQIPKVITPQSTINPSRYGKLIIPIDGSDADQFADEIDAARLPTATSYAISPFFRRYTSPNRSISGYDVVAWDVIFYAPTSSTGLIQNGLYPRTELREQTRVGTDSGQWTLSGSHIQKGTLRVTQVPNIIDPNRIVGIVFAQILTTDTNLPVVQLYFLKRPSGETTVFAEYRRSALDTTMMRSRALLMDLGESFDYEIAIIDGKLTGSINGSSLGETDIRAGFANKKFYFTAGVMVRNNANTASGGGEVIYRNLSTQHVKALAFWTPSEYFNLQPWYLGLPVDADGGLGGPTGKEKAAASVKTPELVAGYESPYFYMSGTGWLTFFAPSNGASSSPGVGSNHTRSELRELYTGSWKVGSSSWSNKLWGKLTAVARVDKLSANSAQAIIGQIHGWQNHFVLLGWHRASQSVRLTLVNKNDGSSQKTRVIVKEGIKLGDEISYSLELKDTTLNVTVNGATQTINNIDPSWNTATMYFKAGAYHDVNNTGNPEGDATQVSFKKLEVTHTQNIKVAPVPTDFPPFPGATTN